jgi:alkanesulfonate monooxygenase SsuD/methylene tetrahydromethanopterin reductase-like flavin-dependent oxidoreductase (luciferase family)
MAVFSMRERAEVVITIEEFSMRYGVYVPNFGPYGDARILAELAYEAEEAGWDGFFLWDQVSKTTLTPTFDPMVEPWIALAAIALRTRSIRLGLLVTPLPRRRPWMVARGSVSLDHLSAGRLIFGVGSGGGYFDFEALGEASDAKTLAALLDEGLEVLTGLWSGEPYHHDGNAFHIKEAQFLPRPFQSPRIPIWVAGMWPAKAPLRRAARWDGVIPIGRDLPLTGMLTPEEMREIVNIVASAPGYSSPFEVVHMGITGGEDAAHDREVVVAYQQVGITWWVEKILPELGGSWTNWPLDAMRARIQQGPPK